MTFATNGDRLGLPIPRIMYSSVLYNSCRFATALCFLQYKMFKLWLLFNLNILHD